jgi:P-type Ca2+ transporter type 2C
MALGSFSIDGLREPAVVASHRRHARILRLAVPGLVGNPLLARKIDRSLHALPGAEEVYCDLRSGRVRIAYAPGAPLLDRIRALVPRQRRAPAQDAVPWHGVPIDQVQARLEVEPDGLSEVEAARRQRRFGPNLLDVDQPRPGWAIALSQLTNLPTLVLIGSAIASAVLGHLVDAGAIAVVVVLNAGIGFAIERRNERLLASWRKIEAGEASVLRGGEVRQIPAAELVPGDVVLVRSGEVIPADARVIDADRLSSDEAVLTGESEPRSKSPAEVADSAALAERSSMIYSGTTVSSGHGRAVVTGTGNATEVGRVRALIQEIKRPRSPLTRQLDRLTRRATLVSIGAAAVTGISGLLHGRSPRSVMRTAVALGIAAIPEGLPVVATAALVKSMARMRERGMVVRRLSSAETLGGVTVICADKTGTLTENDMRVAVVELPGSRHPLSSLIAKPDQMFDDPLTLTLAAAALNSDVNLYRRGVKLEISGSSTERALIAAAHSAGLDPDELQRAFPRSALLERGNGTNYVVSVHQAEQGDLVFVKGAPEQVLALCTRDSHGRLTRSKRTEILARNDALAGDGLRVLAIAWQRAIEGASGWSAKGFTFLGLIALQDPLRPGAAEAVAAARRAGIRTVIVTGDQRRTAESIARAVGLTGETLDGSELEALDRSGELRARLKQVSVIARVTPADKVRVVRALREAGEIVAMAGDGINDAAALKEADVGIAIGLSSTNLARDVADVVLTNEDLRSILSAVGEGRIVQDNLRRALRFLFATNVSELALVAGASLLGLRDPLTPLQLLWINLLTDTLPALALALEPGDPAVLDRPPADPAAPLLSAEGQKQIARDGALIAASGALGWLVGGPPVAFSTLVGSQLAYATVCRAPGAPMNTRFAELVGSAVALQGATLASHPLRNVLGLGRSSPLEAAGFAVDLLGPAIFRRVFGGEVIERFGPAHVMGGRS